MSEARPPAFTERRQDRDLGLGVPNGVRAFADHLLAGGLSRQQLAEAIAQSEQRKIPLQDVVVSLGFVSEADSYAALSIISHMPLVDLAEVTVSRLAIRLVPEKLARRHTVLALNEDNRAITFAVARPLDIDAERDVGFAAGRAPRPVLARLSQVLEGLDRHYPKMGEVERLIDRLKASTPVEAPEADTGSANTSPIIELCNHILAGAVQAHASDIHIEPFAGAAAVRYRISGILEQVLTLPREARPHVTNRLKVLAKVNIAVKHRPQDGAFRILVGGRPIDVRLSTLPTVHGEKVVMRVVDGSSHVQTIEALGYDEETGSRLRRALKRPDGLVLFTGPTACGKSTALYASLRQLMNGRTNIVTVEDPVERYVEGVNQIPVDKTAGTSFAQVLRSVLRQDPNVIMVGEIRDAEVAQIAGQAAYTGHLVLSSLHTIDAPSAIGRLLNLGLEPFRVSEVLNAVFAQRLVRRLCPHCKILLPAAEAGRLGEEHGIPAVVARAGTGCDACRLTGYIDRIPVAESILPDDTMRRLIRDSASATDLRAAMKQAGFRTMRETALDAVARGITSIEEIDRVLGADEDPHPRARTKNRVLVVDDDRMIRMLVKLLLEKEGYDVIEGENGVQAIELARRERPELLVLDLMMPEMDGFEAIGRLRSEMTLAALPVVVLTAESGPDTERRVLELGADDYLVKPFEPGVLLSRVRAVFRRTGRVIA
jgi:type II secretory ATPase GspE/PulE/Tfp pilus assembly ATPase PilB-like protein